MGREWRMKVNASERIKSMRTVVAATKRLGLKPSKAVRRYLGALEMIKQWTRKEKLATGKLKRYRAMEKRYAKKLGQGGKEDGAIK